jgi:hypothetical protein
MNKKNDRKLSLTKTTIRDLMPSELRTGVGGITTNSGSFCNPLTCLSIPGTGPR